MNRLLQAAASCLLAIGASTSSAQDLSLADAIALLRESPALVAGAEQVAASRLAAGPAGALPDPKVLVAIDNLPIEGPDQYSFSRDFMTMQRIGVMQEFPNRAKRAARVASAAGRIAVAEAQSSLTRLGAIQQVVMAWIARRTAERQLVQLDAMNAENRLLESAVRARLSTGQGLASDAVVARTEAALIEERRDAFRALREQALAVMRQWLGGAAAELPLSGEVPSWPIDRAVLLQRLPHHSEFALWDAQGQNLDAEVAAARAAKRPDWSMEMAFQRRGSQFGNMVSMQVTVDLPIFARSRQSPQLAATLAERRALSANREAGLREHRQQLESGLAEYGRLRDAVARQRTVFLPLAAEKVTLTMADWRGGKSNLMDVINSRRERLDAEQKLIALEGEQLQAAATLRYSYDESKGEQP
jgi:outer membrane protein, heavy metal efflux system